ncbi:MAG: hypothetical protein PHY80_05070 [Rickettsiales bacterium]|nr:hypothetical protein [Rickettsiales bacterium]
MKSFKYILVLLLCSTLSAFAEDYNDDIYGDDSSSSDYSKSSTPKYQKDATKTSSKKTNEDQMFEGYVLSEFYVNTLTDSKDKVRSNDSSTNSYLYLESLAKLNFGKGFFAETKWYLKPVNKRLYTNDIYGKDTSRVIGDSSNSDFYGKDDYVKRTFQFSSYGLGVETLYAGYKNSNLAFGLGKIIPTFGSAYDKSRFSGVYGISMPEEYKLIDKIGGYVSAIFPFGDITFNMFYDDTSDLSNTMFKKQGRDKSKGGAGNTDKLNNFSLTFNGKFDDLSLNVGYRQLEASLPRENDENGYVIGAEYLVELPYDINFLPFAEFTYLDDFDGMKSRNVSYLTTFLPLIYENWHFIVSNTSKYDNEKGYHNYTSYLTQASIGYKFDFGLMVDVAKVWERYVKKADDFNEVGTRDKWVKHSDSWAFMVSYLYQF